MLIKWSIFYSQSTTQINIIKKEEIVEYQDKFIHDHYFIKFFVMDFNTILFSLITILGKKITYPFNCAIFRFSYLSIRIQTVNIISNNATYRASSNDEDIIRLIKVSWRPFSIVFYIFLYNLIM